MNIPKKSLSVCLSVCPGPVEIKNIRNVKILLFAGIHIIICFSEIIMYKVLMLFGFKHFCSSDEDFTFVFIILFNISFEFATQFSRWMLGSLETYLYEILTGTYGTKSNQRNNS